MYNIKRNIGKWSTAVGMLLVALTLLCRFSTGAADIYALRIYPVVSGVLSLLSSVIPFSLQEATLTAFVALAIWFLLRIRITGWRRCLRREGVLLMWLYVWFYGSWCINYSRSSLFERSAMPKKEFREQELRTFATLFIHDINEAWTPDSVCDKSLLEAGIKAFYSKVPARYGLSMPHSWQHPKPMLYRPFYSAVGVQGFMAPLFAESVINSDVLSVDYPFVYAHETAHLLGVSSEAEANWWAYNACLSMSDATIRYSAYKGILPHIMKNVGMLLPAEDADSLRRLLRPEVIKDYEGARRHWQQFHCQPLNDTQNFIYDTFLKSNSIASGMNNYSEVVQMLLSVRLR